MNHCPKLPQLLLVIVFVSLSAFAQKLPDKVRVIIQTELGQVEVEIYPTKAPLTAANFLQYVDGGFYDGGLVHRTVKPGNQPNNAIRIEVIQASIHPDKKVVRRSNWNARIKRG